jgi:hypothetical protein
MVRGSRLKSTDFCLIHARGIILHESTCIGEKLRHYESVLGIAGWSSPVARQAHNLKVAGSNPAPATIPYRLGGKGLGLWGIAADTKTDTNFGAP